MQIKENIFVNNFLHKNFATSNLLVNFNYNLINMEYSIKPGDRFNSPNGNLIKITNVFEGRSFPMVNYQIGERNEILSASLYWFEHLISTHSITKS